jgi:lycopene beta-cyclase
MAVLEVEDEEYCYIPMGGELPDPSQRVVAFGGAANMVHPSTGKDVYDSIRT